MNTAISTVSGKQKHNYQMQQELLYKCISGSVKRKVPAGHGQHRDFFCFYAAVSGAKYRFPRLLCVKYGMLHDAFFLSLERKTFCVTIVTLY